MRTAAIAFALAAPMAGFLCGQPQSPRPEVYGMVLEPGSNQPVVDAKVTVFLIPDPPPRIVMAGQQDVYLTTKTDINGRFSFQAERFGTVRVRVEKEGFSGAAAMLRPPTDQASITLDKDHPRREVQFQLGRPGEITGRVVDEETRKPLAKVKVAAYQADYFEGKRRPLFGGAAAVTDADGQFRIGGLRPTQYLVAINPVSQEEGRIQLDFKKEDFEAVEQDWERTWWPGGRDPDSATPLRIASGEVVNAGLLVARKGPLYRAKVSASSPGCAAGELVRVFMVVRTGMATNARELGTAPCGRDFLITRLQPGACWLELRSEKRTPEARERALVAVEIVHKNVEIKTGMGRGVDIGGRLVVTEGARKPDWKAISLLLDPIGGFQFADESPGPPDAAGAFRLVNVEPRDYRLRISGLGKGFYVKEVRYNGARADDGVFAVNGGALDQKLEIEVDDKPAVLTGTVKDGDHAVGEAHVVLVRWPVNPQDRRVSTTTTTADADGKFQLMGLVPAEYRYFAIRAAAKDKLQEPYVMDGLLQSAKKITLAANGMQTLEVEVVNP